MSSAEFEAGRARTRTSERAPMVTVTPQFDGAGGVLLLLEVPDDSGLRPGASITVKVWAGPVPAATPLPALGAPTAVRTAEVPFAEYAAGAGYEAAHAPPFYAVTTRVFAGFDVIAESSEVFDVVSNDVVRTLSH